MPPAVLRKLTAIQNARLAEIERSYTRLKEKQRDSFTKDIVQLRIKAINEIWAESRKTHSDIVARDDAEGDPYMTDNVYARMQNVYEDASDWLLSLSSELEAANEPTLSVRASDDNAPEVEPPVAKLPRLDLPSFSGCYEDWDSFHDLFVSLVHSNPRITDATKLQYLKSCLTDEAAGLVKDITITNANYSSTWQALKTRFYNPRLIVNNYIRALMDLPYLKKESAADLRDFTDTAQRIVRALRNLKMPVQYWDAWFVLILGDRLDPESRKLWESELSAVDHHIVNTTDEESADSDILKRFPTFCDLAKFLERRAQTLSMIPDNRAEKRSTVQKPVPSSRRVFHTGSRKSTAAESKCPLCSEPHALIKCNKFSSKSPYDRYADVRRLRLCFNCLGAHAVRECSSKRGCGTCRENHHTLLHFTSKSQPRAGPSTSRNNQKPVNTESSRTTSGANVHTASVSAPRYSVILATAQVIAIGPTGKETRARALLDQGSEVSFVSNSLAQLLGLEKQQVEIPLTGLGLSEAGIARSRSKLTIRSTFESDFQLEADVLVLGRLTSQLPARKIMHLDLKQFDTITLADPHFYKPDSIDIILGADIYGQLLRSGLRRFSPSTLTAQNTTLGWIVSGSVASRRAGPPSQAPLRSLHCFSDTDLNDSLTKFWELEEVPTPKRKLNPEDEACENQFVKMHTRNSDGRYTVRLPVNSELPNVAAETRAMALKSLAHSYRRFSRDPKIELAYREFMETYERLGHMTRIPKNEIENSRAWYLPHHAVVQATATSWKIRVVFDASRRTSAQHYLNKFLSAGPPLQRDLSLILLNWRKYKYVFTADIVKMFRQIQVDTRDRDLQRIVWAPTSNDPPVEYRLNTVTYGTACAPFLAIRTLLQVAQDERSRFPLGARCLEQNTYVDDAFAGANDLSIAVQKRDELIQILESAGIELDKWAANHRDLLPARLRQMHDLALKKIDSDESVKALGVRWNASKDNFIFNLENLRSQRDIPTKRSILSTIARLFDPLGWLAPITVTAKILMQDLWILKCDWDSALPAEARDRWLAYCDSLSSLSELSLDRWLGTTAGSSYQLHGFSDASSRAYAAAVYLRVDEGDNRFRISLLAAKTKVAPVKTVSIPNLELCGAALLVKLINHLRKLKFLENIPVFAWSDSQIVLTWLRKHPCHWKTFVANRVSFIQTELPAATWRHVPTKENPADLATRGCTPLELANNGLWWHGPSWLSLPAESWPQTIEKIRTHHAQAKVVEHEHDILTRYSSLNRLIRVVAYCLRPLYNLRRRKNNLEKSSSFLTSNELSNARTAILRLDQATAFVTEINLLKSGKTLPKRNALVKLNPFVDKQGILRVGGRLTHAEISHDAKHPPILPYRSALSRLFVRQAHLSSLHGGPTLTTSRLVQNAWILGRRKLVKTEIRNCIVCQRVKPRLAHQLMGNLPASRVTPARPFTSSGLDYAGPIQVRTTKGRGHRSYKGYVALFVCFATRAIHLELVSDLTTATFIAAYRRFVSRRGICRNLYSDNATTFHGADKELRAMFNAASEFYNETASTLANDGTNWTFIPPNAPHYGGLWEAGVKSAKHHLKRVIGDHTLTFEELTTLLAEIEACLNSRPLCSMTADIEDLNVLTPAHFLIGDVSGVIPDEEPPSVPENRLSRFQLLHRIRNQFWKRWSLEYLNHLQERGKWRTSEENFAVGQMVLIKDDRYPPSKWPLGRVLEIHPGPDNQVRVVTVKTASNTLRRHIARLCPLSLEQDNKDIVP